MRHDLSKESSRALRLCPPLKPAGSNAAQPVVTTCHNTGSCSNLVMTLWISKNSAIRAEVPVSVLHTK